MREIIQKLNKSTLAEDTGLSYGRLRKYASGVLNSLTEEEIKTIHDYLLKLAEKIKI